MFYFLITLLLFASMEVVSKPIMQSGFDPFLLTFIRFGLGFITLISYAVYKKQFLDIFKVTNKQLGQLFLLGFINVFFSMSLLQIAVRETNAATVALIFCSNPLFVLIISLLFKDEPFSLKRVFAFMIGLVGIITASITKGLIIDNGSIYAIIASISFALYVVLSKKALSKISALNTNIISFGLGLLSLLIYLMIFNPITLSITSFETIGYNYAMVLIYLGIGVSGLGYITFMRMLQKLSASSASVIFFIKPIIATILSMIFLNELLDYNFYIGLLLVSIGSFLILKPMNTNLLKKYKLF